MRNPCRVRGAGQDHSADRPIATVAQVAALADTVDLPWSVPTMIGGEIGYELILTGPHKLSHLTTIGVVISIPVLLTCPI